MTGCAGWGRARFRALMIWPPDDDERGIDENPACRSPGRRSLDQHQADQVVDLGDICAAGLGWRPRSRDCHSWLGCRSRERAGWAACTASRRPCPTPRSCPAARMPLSVGGRVAGPAAVAPPRSTGPRLLRRNGVERLPTFALHDRQGPVRVGDAVGNDVVDLLDDALGVLRDHLHVKRDRSGETTVGGAYEAIERAVRTHAGAEACRSSSGPRHGRAPLPSPRRAGLRVRPAQRAWDPGVFRSLFHGND